MKSMYLLILMMTLVLVGCEQDPATAPTVEGWNPSMCREKSSSGCGVDWYINLKTPGLPQNVEIVLNEVSVINECDPQSYWTVSSTSTITEFKINDYVNLAGTEKVNLAVYDLKDCSQTKVLKAFTDGVVYEARTANGVKTIIINN